MPLATLVALLCSSCSLEESKEQSNTDGSKTAVYQSASSQKKPSRPLKIATTEDPVSFDSRIVRDLYSATYMRLLYEGLTRADSQGVIQPAIAEKIAISDDLKTYTFTLRKSNWSDASPLTAHDFVETWQSMLSPAFPAPNAYQLYLIKGAKDAKEGRLDVADIGVKATSPDTLVVELEQPTPYFLEMTSCHFYFPVHSQLRQPAAASQSNQLKALVSNGPFSLAHHIQRNEFAVIKNPLYWDKEAVKIDGIAFQILDEHTALQLFKAGDLDWAGSPLSTLPQDAVASLKAQGWLNVAPGSGTHWFRFNTGRPPFDNEKLRRAFALAIDRQAIVEHVTQGNQQPAIGIVPPAFGIDNRHYFADHDSAAAKALFAQALADMHLTPSQLPRISLYYAATDRNHKIAQAVQQQWNKTFNIDIALESTEAQVLLDKLRQGTYQISLGSWYADIQDPINFLEIFKSKQNPTNQTSWEDPAYTQLLEQSSLAKDPSTRLQLMAEAEKKLIAAMPVAPLFHSAYNYLKNGQVAGVYFSPLGYLDFKVAYIIPKSTLQSSEKP